VSRPRFGIYFIAPGTLIAEGDDLAETKARAVEVVRPRFERVALDPNNDVGPAYVSRLAKLMGAFSAELDGRGAGWVRIVDRTAPPTMHIVCDALAPGAMPLGAPTSDAPGDRAADERQGAEGGHGGQADPGPPEGPGEGGQAHGTDDGPPAPRKRTRRKQT
jgi:hypothetical protein